jgi:hypothetical protein
MVYCIRELVCARANRRNMAPDAKLRVLDRVLGRDLGPTRSIIVLASNFDRSGPLHAGMVCCIRELVCTRANRRNMAPDAELRVLNRVLGRSIIMLASSFDRSGPLHAGMVCCIRELVCRANRRNMAPDAELRVLDRVLGRGMGPECSIVLASHGSGLER